MGNGMNKVLTGLYIGSVRDSKDVEQLKANCITHIISIHDNARRGGQEDVEYLCIMASDTPNQNLSQFFSQCNDFIHGARLSGGSVLIHCLAGVSRSVTIAVAYLMSVTSLNCKEALEAIRGARSISSPNSGFQKQLQDFENRKLKSERRRLRTKFPQKKLFSPEDEEEVRKLISKYHAIQTPEEGENGSSLSANTSGACLPNVVRSSPNASPTLGSSYRRSPHVQRKLTTFLRENKTL